MGLLDTIYSASDSLKRRVKGLLADPVGTLQQGVDNVLPTRYQAQQGLLGMRGLPHDQLAAAEGDRKVNDLALNINPVMMFAGVNAKTADLAKQGLAQKLLSKGEDPAKVWKETGWGIGPDGKWRFEIPDNTAHNRFSPSVERMRDINGEWISSSDFLTKHSGTEEAAFQRIRNTMNQGKLNSDTPRLAGAFVHEPMMASYPDLMRDTKITINNNMPIGDAGYSAPEHLIQLSPLAGKQADSTTLHELQHAIQQREGFASGGSPDAMELGYNNARARLNFLEKDPDYISGQKKIDDLWESLFNKGTMTEQEAIAQEAKVIADHPALAEARKVMDTLRQAPASTPEDAYKAYQRLAGEAESRLTQSRMDMDAGQRASQYPWEPQYFEQATGVPLKGLLFRYE